MLGFFDKYPYTDFHELNLDWIISKIRELTGEIEAWKAVNSIHYAGVWNITKQYPAWSVVETPDGTEGYLSLKPVPVGIDISNSEYWMLIANYSAIVSDLGQRVTDLEGDVDTINNEISDLNGYNNFSSRKVLCISDSYGLMPSISTSWIAFLQTILGIPNENFYRCQYSGSGVIGVSPGHTFLDIVTSLTNTLTADEKTSMTDIVIMGGYNDAYAWQHGSSSADFTNDINSLRGYLRNNYPNAKVYVGMPGWGDHYDRHLWLRLVKYKYAETFLNHKNTCFIDNIDWMHNSVLRDSTGFHPTEECSRRIAQTIASVMVGGSPVCDLDPTDYGAITPTFSHSQSGFSWSLPKMLYRNGIVSFSWSDIKVALSADQTALTDIKLGEFTKSIMTGGDTKDFAYRTNVSIHNAADNSILSGELLIYNNELHLIPHADVGQSILTIYGSTMIGDVML